MLKTDLKKCNTSGLLRASCGKYFVGAAGKYFSLNFAPSESLSSTRTFSPATITSPSNCPDRNCFPASVIFFEIYFTDSFFLAAFKISANELGFLPFCLRSFCASVSGPTFLSPSSSSSSPFSLRTANVSRSLYFI